jgi:hypothetical protein
MIFLSFDIASRSLAFTLMKYNVNFLEDFAKIIQLNDVSIYDLIIFNSDNINIKLIDVVDLNQGKKNIDTNILEKTKKLKEVLNCITILLNDYISLHKEQVKILLEYQMSANYQANVVFNQIFYHFSDFNPVVISPCYKNKIYFSKDLEYKYFAEKYKNSYSANKSHSKANFLYFIESFSMLDNISHIKKKNIDDAADSFMQIFAYINYYLKKNQTRC